MCIETAAIVAGDWTKAVTSPLGLAGFALFLVFGYLAKVTSSGGKRWLAPVAVFFAFAALVGGLAIAYRQVPGPLPTPAQASKPALAQQAPLTQSQTNQVQQTSTGAGSPTVQGVQGDVTITVDQSAGKTRPPTPPAQKPGSK